MLLYFGQNITITATGSQLKSVTCEKCLTQFHYQLSRQATGTASAPYYLFQDAAKLRAEKQAQKRLAKRLNREQELVPCPSCKWINESALKPFRKTQHKGWSTLAWVLLFLGSILYIILLGNSSNLFNHDPDPFALPLLILAAVTITLTISAFIIRALLRGRINPNVSINGKQRIPPGTPPALLPQPAPDGGPPILVPVPSDTSNLAPDIEWALFRPGQLVLQPFCCLCLAPSTATYKMPMHSNTNFIPVPLCNPCLAALRKKWWLLNLAGFLAALLLPSLIIPFTPSPDAGVFAMIAVVGFILALFSFCLIDIFIKPYRFRLADKARGIFKIRFKNPAYTAILIRKSGEQDGLFPSSQ